MACTEGDVAYAMQVARGAGAAVRVVGAGHSFSPIDVSPGAVVVVMSPPTDGSAIQRLGSGTVRVHAGVHIWQVNAQLEAWGLALANMGAIANQTIAGATSTSTHGTGATGSLATFIVGITGVLPNGTAFNASATVNPSLFAAGRVGYGALFIATWFNIRVAPLWRMEQISAPVPLPFLLQQLPALRQQFDRLQWYWFPYTDGNATLLLRVNTTAPITGCWDPLGPPPSRPVTPPPHGWPAWPVGTTSCVDVSYKTLTHNGDDASLYTEMEMMVPADSDVAIINDFLAVQQQLQPMHDPAVSLFTGVRYVQADDITLSPFAGRDTAVVSMIVAGNATSGGNQTEVALFDTALESLAFTAYDARPHPGKVNWFNTTMMATAYRQGDAYAAFTTLRDEVDPSRLLGNPYLTRLFG